MFFGFGQKVVSFLGSPEKCQNGPENEPETRHNSKGISYMFPHILQAQNTPDPNIYTPQGEASSLTFWGPAGHPRDLAGLVRPSGNLYQKVPHFGADCARSGTKVPPNLPGSVFRISPFWGLYGPRFLRFLDFLLPDFRISRFHIPEFSISHLQISRFLDFQSEISGFLNFPPPYFRISVFSTFVFSRFLCSNFYTS